MILSTTSIREVFSSIEFFTYVKSAINEKRLPTQPDGSIYGRPIGCLIYNFFYNTDCNCELPRINPRLHDFTLNCDSVGYHDNRLECDDSFIEFIQTKEINVTNFINPGSTIPQLFAAATTYAGCFVNYDRIFEFINSCYRSSYIWCSKVTNPEHLEILKRYFTVRLDDFTGCLESKPTSTKSELHVEHKYLFTYLNIYYQRLYGAGVKQQARERYIFYLSTVHCSRCR